MVELRRLELCFLSSYGGGDSGRVEGLTNGEAGVLLALALKQDGLVLDGAEFRGAPLGEQQLVQRRVDRIDQGPERDVDLAAPLGAGIPGIERNGRQEPRPGLIERGQVSLDLERVGP